MGKKKEQKMLNYANNEMKAGVAYEYQRKQTSEQGLIPDIKRDILY